MVQSSLKIRGLLLWLHLLWFPGTFEKCIFDYVQQSVNVVIPPPGQSTSFLHMSMRDVGTNKQATPTGPKATPSGPNNTPHLHIIQTAGKNNAQVRSPVIFKGHMRIKRQVTLTAKPQTHSGGSAPLPIRIKIWIPQESPALSQVEQERLEPAVTEAVSKVSNILSAVFYDWPVNRVPSRLLLNRDINKFCKFLWRNASVANYNKCGRWNENYRKETCLGVTIPDEHLSSCAVYPHPDSPSTVMLRPEGVGLPDTDFVVYLHTQNTDKCHSEPAVLAYAVHCQTDRHGRPLAGVAVICKDRLRGSGYSHSKTVQTLVHELFHVLGFSKQLFDTWKDCSHSPQMGEGCSCRGHVTNTDDTGQVRIYTQSVIQAMQTHLGSSNAELGGPLENLVLGAHGYSSHWEARVLQGSIMVAALGDPELVRIDTITLAALQDTGWYQVNRSAAQSLEWGKGQGEHFGSLTTCGDDSSTFFCSGSGSGCHYLHLHKGTCQTDEYLEGCRIYKPLINASECRTEGGERATERSGEIYGPESCCFFSNLHRENISLSPSGSVEGRCYRHRCTGLNQYQVQVFGSDWVDCPAGTSIQVFGYTGSILCPDKTLCHHSYVTAPTSYEALPPPGPPTSGGSSSQRQGSSATGFYSDSPPSSTVPESRVKLPVITALGGAASLCLTGALTAFLYLACRGHYAPRVRVHAVADMETA